MNNNNFFDVNKDPLLCLNKMEPSYENKKWSSCENSKNERCCNFYEDNEDFYEDNEDLDDAKINKIKSLDKFHNFLDNSDGTGIINQYVIKSNEFLNKLKPTNNTDSTVNSEYLKELTKLSIKLDENHRLLTKQYNELIFSPNEVINVDENINKFRYLELDRKLEKYDKKTYSLYKIFFYIMLITSGTLFIRKQIKK